MHNNESSQRNRHGIWLIWSLISWILNCNFSCAENALVQNESHQFYRKVLVCSFYFYPFIEMMVPIDVHYLRELTNVGEKHLTIIEIKIH